MFFVESLKISVKSEKSLMKKYLSMSKNTDLNEVVFDYFADLPVLQEFEEGNVTHMLIKARKRNAKLREEAIKKHGLICRVCNDDMETKYHEKAVAHVHHINPLSTLLGSVKTSLSDVVVLCPNCHMSIHKTKEALHYEELIKIVNR